MIHELIKEEFSEILKRLTTKITSLFKSFHLEPNKKHYQTVQTHKSSFFKLFSMILLFLTQFLFFSFLLLKKKQQMNEIKYEKAIIFIQWKVLARGNDEKIKWKTFV